MQSEPVPALAQRQTSVVRGVVGVEDTQEWTLRPPEKQPQILE